MPKSNDQGFSLVEVLIGMVIFSVGALVSAVLIISSVKNAEVSKNRSAVSALVQQRLEELRARPWVQNASEPALTAGGDIYSNAQLQSTSFPSFDQNFGETVNTSLSGAADSGSRATFYLITWQIVDLQEGGVAFKRITIKGTALYWRGNGNGWQPMGAFDHVAMIYREDRTS